MGRKFAIITDSGCDMPEDFLQKHDIACVQLGFTMQNVNYAGENGEYIDEKAFYKKLRAGGMPTTYQVTGETAKTYMEKPLQTGKDVLVIAFSSALSGTANSFFVAERSLRKKYPKQRIAVVDSLSASMGEGLLLYYAVEYAEKGASLADTVAYIEGLKGHICHHFTVDNLFHLKRGGRVTATTAIVGSILKIKPIMKVTDEGKLVASGKAMGRKKALHALVSRVLESKDMGENDPIFISHGDALEDAEYVKALLLQSMPRVQVYIHYIGAVIGSHAGAGTVAVFHKGLKR